MFPSDELRDELTRHLCKALRELAQMRSRARTACNCDILRPSAPRHLEATHAAPPGLTHQTTHAGSLRENWAEDQQRAKACKVAGDIPPELTKSDAANADGRLRGSCRVFDDAPADPHSLAQLCCMPSRTWLRINSRHLSRCDPHGDAGRPNAVTRAFGSLRRSRQLVAAVVCLSTPAAEMRPHHPYRQGAVRKADRVHASLEGHRCCATQPS